VARTRRYTLTTALSITLKTTFKTNYDCIKGKQLRGPNQLRYAIEEKRDVQDREYRVEKNMVQRAQQHEAELSAQPHAARYINCSLNY
jgi:hypothetical protein